MSDGIVYYVSLMHFKDLLWLGLDLIGATCDRIVDWLKQIKFELKKI